MTVPIGTILPYGGLVDGDAKGELQRQGWLICNGGEYSEENYPELENTIGTIYGSPRPGMFNVPDLRGRFLRGVDAGAGRDPDAESRNGGDVRTKLGSVQEDAFQNHNHNLYITGNTTGQKYWGLAPAGEGYTVGPPHGRWTDKVGGNETRPKNIYVNWIIKAKNV